MNRYTQKGIMPDTIATPTAVTLAGLKWQLEPLPGRGLRITAPPGFRVNWQTGIRVMNREWTEIELELEEKGKKE